MLGSTHIKSRDYEDFSRLYAYDDNFPILHQSFGAVFLLIFNMPCIHLQFLNPSSALIIIF